MSKNNCTFALAFWKRGVAQSGSAPGLGPGGRRFESCRPDFFSIVTTGFSAEELEYKQHQRGVAQSGSAPGLGPGGRRFESCRPDWKEKRFYVSVSLFFVSDSVQFNIATQLLLLLLFIILLTFSNFITFAQSFK